MHIKPFLSATILFTLVVTAYPQASHLQSARKPLVSRVQVLPFVGEAATVKFKPHDKEAPDELRVEVIGQQIRFTGTKKGDLKMVLGTPAGWWGKVVLLPLEDNSGTWQSKIPPLRDGTGYQLVFEKADGTLQSKSIKLLPNVNYEWTAKAAGEDFTLEVTNAGTNVETVTMKKDMVKQFGFATTIRFNGSKADVILTAQ